MRTFVTWIVVATLAVFAMSVVTYAYPTSVNSIPTAETVGPDSILLEYGNYGYPKMIRDGSTDGAMVQFGIGSNLELGADRYWDGESTLTYWNGKLKLVNDGISTPAVAVGVMDVANESKPTLYLVSSKALGCVRLHAGYLRASYARGIIAGADIDIGDKVWFGVDYIPGEENYFRFGLSRNVGSDSYVTFSYGKPNDKEFSEPEIGITFSTVLDLNRGSDSTDD